MKRKNIILIAIGGVLLLILFGTAVSLKLVSPSDSNNSGGSQTPLGGLFSRAAAVSDLKRRIGDLRDFHSALMEFAKAHEDDLPKTIAELKPYLPQKLAYLDDEHWEMPAVGKLSSLMNAKDANSTVFLQEKKPGKAKIIVYADGHIEYRK
jgi:hypothetical protein